MLNLTAKAADYISPNSANSGAFAACARSQEEQLRQHPVVIMPVRVDMTETISCGHQS